MTQSAEQLPAQPGDGDLLTAFVKQRQQEAFAHLVRRHGGMVVSVCRSVLGNTSDAEDAAQAVFLTLAQRASRLQGQPTIVGWLHRVAWCVAAHAVRAKVTRTRHEQEVARMRQESAHLGETDIPCDTLHAALERLPEKYRLALLLHYVEGRTLVSTAALLRCNPSTLSMRLTRGRQMLRDRLVKGGVPVSSAGVMAVLAHSVLPEVSPSFVTAATHVAAAVLAGNAATAASGSIAALSKGVLNMLFWAQMKVAAVVVAVTLLISGAGAATYLLAAGEQVKTVGPVVAPPPPAKELTLDLGDKVTMKLVLIPAGKFTMGSPETEKDRSPVEVQHEVTISKPFWLGTTTVTQEQYKAVMGKNSSTFEGPTNPVENVSWNDAVEFCKKLSAKTGKLVRLPTEAEWEYACRAGSKTRFSFGDTETDLDGYAWYTANSDNKTHPVGQKKPNAWGLYDMHGNVFQWCQDWYDDYEKGAATDPTGAARGSLRVLRGGSYLYKPWDCRSARRHWFVPGYWTTDFGFRVAVVGWEATQPATGRAAEALKSALLSGAELELVAVSEYPDKGAPWWRPDGTTIADPPIDPSDIDITSDINPEKRKIELVFRLGGKAAKPGYDSRISGCWWTGRRGKRGAMAADLQVVGIAVPVDSKTLSVDLRVAAGPWKDVVTSDGQRAMGPLSTAAEAPNYDDHTTLITAELKEGLDAQVTAVDQDGVAHVSGTVGIRPGNVAIQDFLFPRLAPGRFKSFTLRTRPYELIHLKDIALAPGERTDPRMVAADTVGPGSQPATGPATRPSETGSTPAKAPADK